MSGGKARGDWGEALTANYLREHGYEIVASQYRTRFGELDLVAQRNGILCFVEVKLRKNTEHGLPREFVTLSKQRKLRAAAQYYLMVHNAADMPCRFDVAEVYPEGDGARIEYIENAFW